MNDFPYSTKSVIPIKFLTIGAFVALSFFFIVPDTGAQTLEDSVTVVNLRLTSVTLRKGVIHKSVQTEMLYGTPQNINIIEIGRKSKLKPELAAATFGTTSDIARQHQAVVAVNGSYFNMKTGASTCYYRVNGVVADSTDHTLLKQRVNGAVELLRRKTNIFPWDLSTERSYNKKKGAVLASGPLMLTNGKICDFTKCSKKFVETKHPRSAICVAKDGTVWLVTVDGRSPENAGGMNIHELAHLLKILGAESALNLDGGGSTTLWSAEAPDNGVLNMPSDNRKFDHQGERKVANIVYYK